MVLLLGQVEMNMLEIGKTGDNMDMVYLLKKEKNRKKENGKTGKELNGWMLVLKKEQIKTNFKK